MTQIEDFKISETDVRGKKYPFKITFSQKVNSILKKYCYYQTFVFLYETRQKAEVDLTSIKNEIKQNYTGNLIINY